jgi:general secretion pathway protein G
VVEDIRNIVSLLDIYYLENNEYPNNFDKVGVGALRDPWGTPYQYVNLKTDYGERRKDNSENPINSFYDLWSNGKDGKTHKQVSKKEGRDDIIRARDGEFIGYGREFD